MEFYHTHILEHLEQYGLDTKLYSRWCPATRYFCSQEVFTQNLYENNSYWQQSQTSDLSLDRLTYSYLREPLFNLQNLKFIHPPDPSRG